ncbi:MAG: metalloregulator ArsR/SmtB family transcription factor [Oscillibacter sp.]|jgi:DNA-binding transcriptional ArsR family regulator|nr:metalloregulator ArsR/SmtB family transcription factor [Oscillibacter sp.]
MELTGSKITDYQERAALLKALSNPVRLEIVHTLLHSGCRNVGCMERGTGMSQSCISQHLQRLRTARVVRAERVGNEVYYRVSSPETARLLAVLFGEEAEGYVL